jgi:hypothetical protein
MKNLLTIIVFVSTLVAPGRLSAQESYNNAFAISIPLPGIFVVEGEHFITPYNESMSWSAGLSLGYGYPVESGQGLDDLLSNPVGFQITSDYAINPFVRLYMGDPEKLFRPGVMLKPSLVIMEVEREDYHYFPSYEIHFIGNRTFAKRYYLNFGIGIKHFLKYSEVSYGGESAFFPSFRFDATNLNEQPKQWLPAMDLAVGIRF